MQEPQMQLIAHWIAQVLNRMEDESVAKRVRAEVEALCEKFPLYENRRVTLAGKA
jgi:glycine/serine hydroxymethyltransferase